MGIAPSKDEAPVLLCESIGLGQGGGGGGGDTERTHSFVTLTKPSPLRLSLTLPLSTFFRARTPVHVCPQPPRRRPLLCLQVVVQLEAG